MFPLIKTGTELPFVSQPNVKERELLSDAKLTSTARTMEMSIKILVQIFKHNFPIQEMWIIP